MENQVDSAALMAAMLPFYLFSLAIGVLAIVAMWKIFTKAGEPGWASIVPIYNTYVLTKISGYNPILFLLFLIPLVNVVFGIMVLLGLGRAFGKSTGWSVVFLVLLNVIGMLILGFSSDQYRNPAPLSQPTYR
jgi:small-conductance mechanosensitive channel